MKTIKLALSCLLVFVLLTGCGGPSAEQKKSQAVSKPEIQYSIQKKDVPKADPATWAPGSKRQITYWVQVPKGIAQEHVKKVAEYLVDTDAKPLKNWNVAYFVFFTTDNQSSGFATAVYTKNANIPDGNQVKPGQYNDFIWGWNFLRQP